jgi:hypothetical protein
MLCGQEQCRDAEATHLTATIWGVSCEVLPLKFDDMSSMKLQSMLPTRRLFNNNQTLSHREFFYYFRWFCLLKDAQITVGLQVKCHQV